MLDEDNTFAARCNMAMVELEPIPEEEEVSQKVYGHAHDLETAGRVDVSGDMTRFDAERLRSLVYCQAELTGSRRAREILDNWAAFLPKFRKVIPVEYRRALAEMAKASLQAAE